MKKVVVKIEIHDDKEKQKAMKSVSGLSGIESISVDMKERKMTIVGDVDPVQVVGKLRKSWHAEIVTVGPAKEEKKKEETPKKDDDNKKNSAAEIQKHEEYLKFYNYCNPHLPPAPYSYSAEENPNACVIC